MNGRVLFLGAGGSLGVPIVGCHCSVCTSSSPFNKRLRPSILLEIDQKTFIIDVGPDFRQQALRYRIDHLDGVLLTHSHYDHISGIDELRIYSFYKKHPVPCLLSQPTFEELSLRANYLFPSNEKKKETFPKFSFHLLEEEAGVTNFQGIQIGYMSYFQVGMRVSGFRIGNFAYLTDISLYSSSLFTHLQEIDILVISGRRFQKSDAHISIDEGIAFSHKTSARSTYFTHLSHEIDYQIEQASLPKNMHLAFDGLELFIEAPSHV